MPKRRASQSRAVARKTTELALAAPQVIAHRLTRMARAGVTPSARDRKEFQVMGAEKVAAFAESWGAMAAQAFQANQKIGLALLSSLWSPGATSQKAAKSVVRQANQAVLGIIEKGMTPVHKRAVANAKRLGRAKLK
ncbi:MAG: hypothetical protein IPP10_06385 [Candidatus Competibacteraceae bacterium]|nr:hypothetical protein [Candidatus Competibacteraceae bacterium]MBK7983327.1 hypothetical protein [Candidatus Competibacteraceae bacterium]MBK8898127.1 hypothetical protein [Candidatus Competibacteraceae bacterium]MBK8961933.1 hypothetical protein [Candidatus Competibacteraceae bacterium]MBK9951150.1 hypothetical protein [Candidatus Competibacteraceae bacterium]